MKRSPMRRTPFKRKRPDPATTKAWKAVKAALWARAEGRCEVPWCSQIAHDPHHVKKRSQGGLDTLDNLVALCRPHHQSIDLSIPRGGLRVTACQTPHEYGFRFTDFYDVKTRGPWPYTKEAPHGS